MAEQHTTVRRNSGRARGRHRRPYPNTAAPSQVPVGRAPAAPAAVQTTATLAAPVAPRPPVRGRSAHTSRNASRNTSRGPRPEKKHRSGATKTTAAIPPLKQGVFRIIPVGGCEEVGQNMTIFEYGNDILILDIGLQFPEEDMPGIDFIIPNTKYLEGKEKNIRAVIFTHGHLDHIGGAPIVLEKLKNPPIVARPLTTALIKHKQEDYKKGTAKHLKVIPVNTLNDTLRFGELTVRFFQVEHSIMDSMGVVIESPAGSAIHAGDWTMERDAEGKTHIFYDRLAEISAPSILMLESLGALKNGRHGTYQEMYNNLQKVLSDAPGRIIIATFASQVERVKWVIQAAAGLGKKVALDGYSMKVNIEIAKELGYVKIPKGVLIDIAEIDRYDQNKVVIICTGGQGEERAVLSRITLGEHRSVKLQKQDTVVFSSSIIPGNERTIQRLKDNIYRQCDHVIHGDIMDVHVSGHATRQDILEMLAQVKPTFFMPVYANHFFLKEAKNLAAANGFPEDKIIVPDNGTIVEIENGVARVLPMKAPTDYVFVDGLGVSDSQHVVLRDRQVLAEDGMLVIIATVESKSGKLLQNPDIISRGFVFLKDNRELIESIRTKVKKLVTESSPEAWSDSNQIRNDLREKVGQFVFTKTQKRPMILPVLIEV